MKNLFRGLLVALGISLSSLAAADKIAIFSPEKAIFDTQAAITPLLPAAAIAILTVAVNFIVDWFLHKTSGLKDE